jgi:cobalt-zinc-cadmium efflux system outer membrane protein
MKRIPPISKPFCIAAVAAGLLSGCAGTSGHASQGVGNHNSADARAALRQLLGKRLTADSAARVAILNNRNLQATFENAGIAQADLIEAGLLENPVLFGSARFPSRGRGNNLEASISQNFLDLLMLPLKKKMATAELERTRKEISQATVELAAETKKKFYSLQADLQLLERLKLIARANGAGLDFTQRLHDAGNITDLTLLNEQATYSEARVEVSRTEADILADRETLNRLMGLWGSDTSWTLASELPAIPGQEISTGRLEALALSQRHDLAASRYELANLATALRTTRTYRYIGVLEVGADIEKDTDGTKLSGPEASVSLPLFNQGQGKIAKLEAQMRQAEKRFEGRAIDVRSEVREARGRLLANRSTALYYQKTLLPERLKILSQTQLQYNAMQTGAVELLMARKNQVDTERKYIEAWRDYWISRSQLELAVGGNLSPGDK